MRVWVLAALVCARASQIAFVSTLTSQSYTLAVKVLAYSLRRLHPDIPYVVLLTQDISNDTFNSLKSHHIDVRRTEKIDTPYIVDHKATKFQYTKIRLWQLTSFSSLVHLDLDVLPLRSLHSLFGCGHFCAAIRHSDMLNSGVFVFKPSTEVYQKMVEKAAFHNFSSYDGGDQGFFNSFFSDMKKGPMFIENQSSIACPYPFRPLSSSFNYDIGVQYLNNGRQLIDPAIIHYTMGPMKPWKWWSYPLFDINRLWIDARNEMEYQLNDSHWDLVLLFIYSILLLSLCMLYQILHVLIGDRLSTQSIEYTESLVISPLISSLSLSISFFIIPEQTHPTPAWIFVFVIATSWMVFFSSLYTSLRLHRPFSLLHSLNFSLISLPLLFCLPLLLLLPISFNFKVLILLLGGPLGVMLISFILNRTIICSVLNTERKNVSPIDIKSLFSSLCPSLRTGIVMVDFLYDVTCSRVNGWTCRGVGGKRIGMED